jgi:hypothetical protein
MSNDWILTIPKTTSWSDYEKELVAARDWRNVLNYRTARAPKALKPDDRMFVVHDGKVRGWQVVTGVEELTSFTCETTGAHWPGGTYIQRSGPFHYVDGPAMQGFRGIRRYEGRMD